MAAIGKGFVLDLINGLIGLLQDPMSAIAGWISQGPLIAYGFIGLIIFIETGVVFMPFLPGDSLLFAAGVFAHLGSLQLWELLLVVWAAAILGDQCNFFIGHFLGKKIIASGKVKALTPERIAKSEAFMEKWGGLSIFLGRFFPFIRTFVPFLAGMGGMRWHHFFGFNVLGGIVWSSVFTLLGYWFGGIQLVQDHFELLVIGIVLISVIPTAVGVAKSYLNKRRVQKEEDVDK
jgi:membrane-associated protein